MIATLTVEKNTLMKVRYVQLDLKKWPCADASILTLWRVHGSRDGG